MIVGLTVTLALLAVSVGQNINCPNSSVKAKAGQYVITCTNLTVEAGSNITILCKVDPPVNLYAETLDFKRTDSNKVVHSYRHYKDDPDLQAHQYRNRTDLNHAGLCRGRISLSFSAVNQSDKGEYKIYVPELNASGFFHIDVVDRNQPNKMIRNDFSTTEPTEKTATESDDHDAAKIKEMAAIWSVPALIFLLVILSIIWIFILKKKLKKNKGGEEGDNLMTPKAGIKADAESDLRDSQV